MPESLRTRQSTRSSFSFGGIYGSLDVESAKSTFQKGGAASPEAFGTYPKTLETVKKRWSRLFPAAKNQWDSSSGSDSYEGWV